MKKCPFCAEEIQDEAIKCKHCGEMLGQIPQGTLSHEEVMATVMPDRSVVEPPKKGEPRTFFREQGVAVTDTLVTLDGKTYALSQVNGVSKLSMMNPLGCALAVILPVAVFIAAPHLPWLAGICVLLGLVMMTQQLHQVVLTMSSGEVKAFTSQNAALVTRIVEAIQEAIIHRG